MKQPLTTQETRLALMAGALLLSGGCSLNVPSASQVYGGGTSEPESLGASGQNSDDGEGPGSIDAEGRGESSSSSDATGVVSSSAVRDAMDGEAGGAPSGGATGTDLENDAPASGVETSPTPVGAVDEVGVLSLIPGPAELLLYYSFDDIDGFHVPDGSGHGHDGTMRGTPTPLTEAGRVGRALSLLGGSSNQYVQLPVGLIKSLRAASVSAWINLTTNNTWDRLFDFNAGEATWFFFSPTGWNAQTLTHGTHLGVQLDGDDSAGSFFSLTEAVQPGAWHHIAVVWAPPNLSYYLDGRFVHSVAVALAPDDLGETLQNWIGRSSYAADPYLAGQVDEFRLYSGALSDAEISELSAQGD